VSFDKLRMNGGNDDELRLTNDENLYPLASPSKGEENMNG